MPDSVTKIEWRAFAGCDNLTIRGVRGSEAEKFAILSKVPFEYDDSINPIEELMSIKAKMEELQKTFQTNMSEMQESLEKVQKKIKVNKGTEYRE